MPKPIQLFVSESMLKEIVQLWFDGVKDLLDDGKLNNSEDVEKSVEKIRSIIRQS